MSIDAEALARLRSLLANATPGEWMLATSCSWRRILTTAGKPVIVPTIQRSDNHPDMDCGSEYVNAELAVAAVNALPALLDNYEAVARDGWKLVPLEATPAMLQAWWDSGCSDSRKMPDDVMGAAQQDWAAMLAAAPQPARPTPEGAE